MSSRWTFTSESVTEGHPDKMADQISDAVLDAILAEDPKGRVACETLVTTGLAVVAGEITTDGLRRHPEDRARDDQRHRLRPRVVRLRRQHLRRDDVDRPAVARHRPGRRHRRTRPAPARRGEDILNSQGAGDQGMMFGYACDETDDLMPLPIWLAHRLAHRLAEVRKAGILPYLRPDGKTQVTFDYEDGKPVRAARPCSSRRSTSPGLDAETLIKPDLIEHVIHPLLPAAVRRRRLRGAA